MNWRNVAWLLVGCAVGLLIGLTVKSTHESTAYVARPRPDPAAADGTPKPGNPPDSGSKGPEFTRPPSFRNAQSIVNPSAALTPEDDPEPGMGRLLVEFQGLDVSQPEFELRIARLDGTVEVWSSEWTTGRAESWYDLRPGIYEPFWELPHRPGLWGARVRVEEGSISRVHAADFSRVFPMPVPEGLGRLDVMVYTVDGAPLPGEKIRLEGHGAGGEDEIDSWTDNDGTCRFEALAGPCTLVVGDRREPVSLHAGETVQLELRPRDEGAVFFEMPPHSAKFVLVEKGSKYLKRSKARWWQRKRGEEWLFGYHYVRAGEYEVRWAGGSGLLPLTTVDVSAGQVSHVREPRGGIRARFENSTGVGHPTVSLLREFEGKWELIARFRNLAVWPNLNDASSFTLYAPFLEPGRYAIRAKGRTREWKQEEVEVGSTFADVELRIVPELAPPR